MRDERFDFVTPGIKAQRIGHSKLEYQVKENGDVTLYSIRTPRTRRGGGSAAAALTAFLRAADDAGATVRLLASPLDKYTNEDRLVAFYRRHGFVETGERGNPMGDPWMIRNPSGR